MTGTDETAAPGVQAREALGAVIRSVTDRWDEPLDEVHDVPQIVDAVIAAGWTAPGEVEVAWDKGHTSGYSDALRRVWDKPNAPTTPNPYRTVRGDRGE